MKLKAIVGVLFYLCTTSIDAYGQVDRPSLGFGLVGGYRSSNAGSGLQLEYLFFNHIDINVGIATRIVQGVGYSIGTRYYPLGIKKNAGFVNINYMQLPGARYTIEDQSSGSSTYRTNKNKYWVFGIGVTNNAKKAHLLFSLNYSIAEFIPEVSIVSGQGNESAISSGKRKMQTGLGFTLGFIIHPW